MVRYDCPRCGYTTKRKGDITRHLKKNTLCDPILSGINPHDYRSIILRNNNTNDIIIRGLCKRTTVTNTKDNNNITININSYDTPNVGYITDTDIKKCLKTLETSMLKMTRKLYFNPNHPENHSVHKTNMKDKLIKYFKDNKWNIGDQDAIVNTMIDNVRDVLDGCETDKIYDLSHTYENDENFKNKINRSIIIECYNNKPH